MSTSPYGGRGPEVVAVAWTLFAVATIVLALRFCTGWFITRRLRWDFHWVIVTYVLATVNGCLFTVSAVWGSGNHSDVLTEHDMINASKWQWIGLPLGVIAPGTGKLAIVAYILQLQSRTNVKKRLILHGIAWLNMIFDIIQCIMIYQQCHPARKLWDQSIPGNCHLLEKGTSLGVFVGSFSAFSDLALAIYPFFIFWDLNMSWKKKLSLWALFLGGVLAAVAAVIKTVNVLSLRTAADKTYATSPLLIWSMVESWVIIIVGSIPPLRPLFLKGLRRDQPESFRYSKSRSHIDDTKLSELSSNKGLTGLTSTIGRAQPRDSIERMLPAHPSIAVTKDFTIHRESSHATTNASDGHSPDRSLDALERGADPI
ncbi:MAG: hypothetical protein M1821_000418 [Bathelium mastoideum]|nr:MAG: hypothetical protein M1821_000418 [Bathelium mastoideum]KAI9686228.1 MAG: hypothetical protein M1822_003883 [Bathelium mastoideum]